MILDKIKNPNDIKNLSYSELNILSNETRDMIIDVISNNGGHLASSLGVVDLTIALLKSFDFSKDKIIWDVGHQSYAYKILTDRKDSFSTIRKYGGLSGFPKINESKYDYFNTGHSSTSISAGLGYCYSRDLNNDNYKVVSIIGDGSLTGGMAFEALQNVSKLKSNYIIVLNDNNMSISKDFGGIRHALLGIRTSYRYRKIKKVLKKIFESNILGIYIKKFLIRVLNIIKQVFVSQGIFFENLDIMYLGPVDGHNIKDICKYFEKAKRINSPVVIHLKTIKGKGYDPAIKDPEKFHGISPFNIETGEVIKKDNSKTWTDIFSNKIVELANENDEICCITAAMEIGTGLKKFHQNFPNRFFDVGICEQHAVTFASSMALNGMIPVVCIYSTFLQRSFDQIIHDVSLQNSHVVFMVDRAGIVGEDGETHNGVFDIAYLKMIPNMTIMTPMNEKEFGMMIEYAINDIDGPVAIRYSRGKASIGLDDKVTKLEYGKALLINESKNNLVVFAFGNYVNILNNINTELKNINKDFNIINLRFIKPFDKSTVDDMIKKYSKFYFIEEGIYSGSLTQEIENYIFSKNSNVKIYHTVINDTFIEHGDMNNILKKYNFSDETIKEKIINIIDNV